MLAGLAQPLAANAGRAYRWQVPAPRTNLEHEVLSSHKPCQGCLRVRKPGGPGCLWFLVEGASGAQENEKGWQKMLDIEKHEQLHRP
jgi:hypothetical protein